MERSQSRSTSSRGRLDEILDGADIVAYCRGPFCVYADDAVRLLTKKGWPAVRVEDGFPEWAADRLAVDSGTA